MGRREKALPDAMPSAHRRFVEALREARVEAGYTLTQLSGLTPYSPAAVARGLSGQVFLSDELAAALISVLAEDGVSKRLLLDRLWRDAKEENLQLLEGRTKATATNPAETDLRAALNNLYKKAGSPHCATFKKKVVRVGQPFIGFYRTRQRFPLKPFC